MKRFLDWTSMVILWAVCLWGAYGIRETYRGTDLILAGRTAEAREVFLRASRYCHYLEDLVDYCDACEAYEQGDLSRAAYCTLGIVFRGYDPEASALVTQNIRTIYSAFREECRREVEIDLAKRKLVDNMERLQREQKKKAQSSTFRPTSRPSASSDPYNARDYSGADEFYDDHYDDFFDYEDAEDYWYGNH